MRKSVFLILIWFITIFITSLLTIIIYKNYFQEKKVIINSNIEQKDISSKNLDSFKEKILYKDKLPSFIDSDLKIAGINTSNLTKEKWQKFINIIQKKSLDILPKQSDSEYSLIHLAASSSDISLLKYLLGQGYDINEKSKYGETAIMQAIYDANFETVKFLYDNSASLSDTLEIDGKKYDMLELSLMRPDSPEKTKIIDFLKERGFSLYSEKYLEVSNLPENKKQFLNILDSIDFENYNKKNKNFFETVILREHDNEVIEYFLNKNINMSSQKNILNAIAFNKNISERNIQEIIDRGADVNSLGKDSFSPLMNAVANYNFAAVEVFLKNGANLSKKDSLNRTAYDFILPTSNLYEMPSLINQQKMKELLDKYKNKGKS